MVQIEGRLIALLGCTMAALVPLLRRYDPMRPMGRMVNCATLGIMMLSLWNLLPGLHLGVNPLSTVIAGWLGAPGMALLAFAKLLTP